MTLKEFYKKIHGDYEEILDRLSSDTIILRFVRRFPSDPTYAELMEAVQRRDISASFAATHNLKGLAANFAFSDLVYALNDLTEQLRPQIEQADPLLLQKVSECYHNILSSINSLEDGGCIL